MLICSICHYSTRSRRTSVFENKGAVTRVPANLVKLPCLGGPDLVFSCSSLFPSICRKEQMLCFFTFLSLRNAVIYLHGNDGWFHLQHFTFCTFIIHSLHMGGGHTQKAPQLFLRSATGNIHFILLCHLMIHFLFGTQNFKHLLRVKN